MTGRKLKHGQQRPPSGEDGFLLAGAIVLIFLVLLALTVAAPRIAMSLKRDKEVESAHRANQYVRGIRMYYKKFGHYPGSIDQLEKSNNQRFLRQKYIDPLTGKDDWRLIHVGENKTKVKGFFGEDLPGLGTAAGLTSGTGGTTTGTPTSSFGNSSFGTPGSGASPGKDPGSSTASTPGQTGSTGISSQNATDATGTGGPIMGVGSSKSGEAIVVVNEQTNYQDWEFLYDPRIEQLYAKGNLLGGVGTGGIGNGGLPNTPIGTPPTPSDPTQTNPKQ